MEHKNGKRRVVKGGEEPFAILFYEKKRTFVFFLLFAVFVAIKIIVFKLFNAQHAFPKETKILFYLSLFYFALCLFRAI